MFVVCSLRMMQARIWDKRSKLISWNIRWRGRMSERVGGTGWMVWREEDEKWKMWVGRFDS
jgi:hypothetical protein